MEPDITSVSPKLQTLICREKERIRLIGTHDQRNLAMIALAGMNELLVFSQIARLTGVSSPTIANAFYAKGVTLHTDAVILRRHRTLLGSLVRFLRTGARNFEDIAARLDGGMDVAFVRHLIECYYSSCYDQSKQGDLYKIRRRAMVMAESGSALGGEIIDETGLTIDTIIEDCGLVVPPDKAEPMVQHLHYEDPDLDGYELGAIVGISKTRVNAILRKLRKRTQETTLCP